MDKDRLFPPRATKFVNAKDYHKLTRQLAIANAEIARLTAERDRFRDMERVSKKHAEIERLKADRLKRQAGWDADRRELAVMRRALRIAGKDFHRIKGIVDSGAYGYQGFIDRARAEQGSKEASDVKLLDDGCGNQISPVCPECGQVSMEIVRPGKFQCINQECPSNKPGVWDGELSISPATHIPCSTGGITVKTEQDKKGEGNAKM